MEKTLRNYDIGKGQKKDILELISRFKFISKMGENEKLDVSTLTLSKDGWYTTFLRTLQNLQGGKEDKDQTLNFIGELYQEATDCVAILVTTRNVFYTQIAQMLIDAMKEAKGDPQNRPKTGVESLKVTYEKNKMFVSKVETFLEVTDKKIDELKSLFIALENDKSLEDEVM